MKCPKCGKESQIITLDTRHRPWGTVRRKECLSCLYRFPTIEVWQYEEEGFKFLETSKYLIDCRTNNKGEK